MNSASGILRYLADCYRENASQTGISSLASSRVRQSLFVSGEDPVVSPAVIEGQYFVRGKRGVTMANQARLHEKDRELFYGTVFLVGRIEESGSRDRVAFAPLILYRVEVANVLEETGVEFDIDTSRAILNYALLEHFADDEFLIAIEKAVEKTGHTEGCIGEVRRLFANRFPESNTKALLDYPKLKTARELQAHADAAGKSQSDTIHLLPGGAFFLADKSTEMRGVLNDLEAMAEDTVPPSPPVVDLLGLTDQKTSKATRKPTRGHLPVSLSRAQEKILASSHQRAVTLAVGPPGTGKSFTIAALAIEAMSRGETVLIASKMDHAVDVVADKIEDTIEISHACVRGGRSGYLKDLKRFLEGLLSGLHTQDPIHRRTVPKARRNLARSRRELEELEERFAKRCGKEEKRGELMSREGGWFTKWRQDNLTRRATKFESPASLAEELDTKIRAVSQETVSLLQLIRRRTLQRILAHYRGTFQAFSKAIRARTSRKQDEYFRGVNWSALLGAFPIWLVNLSDLHRVIPMERKLFDLVIIDEASQCDIASVIPAFQRAKRAVITGDPKQLRHVSFLPVARQRDFATEHGLTEQQLERFDFRNVSLVDLASDAIADQEAVVFLDEHFRSRPEIIQFSNEEFYAGKLAVMTGHREIDQQGDTAITIRQVDGTRSASGVNQKEIDQILETLRDLTHPERPALSIGILSPFRAQTDALMRELERSGNLAHWLDRHDLLVGTAHSFQGEERDIMLISFALDDESPAASFRFLSKEDVFNVAITRARLENRCFVSYRFEESAQQLASRYLLRSLQPGNRAGSLDRVASSTQPCLLEVKEALESHGFEVTGAFRIGHREIDLLCRKGPVSLGIDLIGFPGPHRPAMNHEQHRMFRRAGIRLFPLSLLEWRVRRDDVLARIHQWAQPDSLA